MTPRTRIITRKHCMCAPVVVQRIVSCTDIISENIPRQHGGSQQTRYFLNMRAHVTTIYGKRTGRP